MIAPASHLRSSFISATLVIFIAGLSLFCLGGREQAVVQMGKIVVSATLPSGALHSPKTLVSQHPRKVPRKASSILVDGNFSASCPSCNANLRPFGPEDDVLNMQVELNETRLANISVEAIPSVAPPKSSSVDPHSSQAITYWSPESTSLASSDAELTLARSKGIKGEQKFCGKCKNGYPVMVWKTHFALKSGYDQLFVTVLDKDEMEKKKIEWDMDSFATLQGAEREKCDALRTIEFKPLDNEDDIIKLAWQCVATDKLCGSKPTKASDWFHVTSKDPDSKGCEKNFKKLKKKIAEKQEADQAKIHSRHDKAPARVFSLWTIGLIFFGSFTS
eukprot:gnl/MRDRNA2_/MRDRNA2_109518_c0_seq1.p1 gnl/MRDRNA2_/MRDRNA2_109518_c0~~gnl/MRDRNA2_/MRDRNA2_109518_c0_seq1.p1  ORF type:complete len:333 (+),score=50.57 gnl/MRDRNA2_/MRDRNA2_109518_c0_seq1:69-1067(+)